MRMFNTIVIFVTKAFPALKRHITCVLGEAEFQETNMYTYFKHTKSDHLDEHILLKHFKREPKRLFAGNYKLYGSERKKIKS